MKLPDRSDRYLCPTSTITGTTLMILHLTGFISGWGWPILYIILLFMGHSIEYRDLRLWRN